MRKWAIGMALLACGAPAMARDPDPQAPTAPAPAELTLDRVFSSPDLNGTQPLQPKLSPDGKWLTLLRNRTEDGSRFDLWAMDTASGEWRMLVDSLKVGSGAELSEAEKMQRERDRTITGKRGIVGYDWTPDGKAILVPLDGDLFLAGLDGSVRKVTDTPGTRLNPVISPAGRYASFVRDQNLVVVDLAANREMQATSDGKDTVHWGEAEFVAQEEMDRRTGYWWSPDDRLIAVERFDESRVGIVARALIGAEDTEMFQQRYPKAGTDNALVELYVMRPDGSGRVKVDLGSNTDIYLARVDWARDGKTLYVQRQSRDQKTLDMLAVDPATGAARILFTEKSKGRSWVNLSTSYRFLKDGSLIWWSERDGYGHLYRLKDGKWTQLTKGEWVVADLAGVDEKKGGVYFAGNQGDALEQHLFAVDLAKPGKITRLTEAGYWNSAVMDGSATRAIVTRSNQNQPLQTYLADTAGKRIAWVEENAVKAGHPYFAYLPGHRETKTGTIKAADGSTLYWEMITPVLEPGKRYPVFFEHYGGPGTRQMVTRAWNPRTALRQYLVSRGYIFFQIDNRGSTGRGKAFEDQLYRAMGTVEVEDQVAGADYLKTLDFVDPRRITTYGWSYGGYMTLKMLQDHPGVFAAGVSGAPVSKWELYDTHYTERYMGDPREVPDAYKASNTVEKALAIRDPLLIIHGMSDDNVVLEHSTVMMARMQAGAVRFESMLYPGQTHRVGGAGVSKHLWTTILDFLDRSAPAR